MKRPGHISNNRILLFLIVVLPCFTFIALPTFVNALTPEEIIRLKKEGVSDEVILKLLEKESGEEKNGKKLAGNRELVLKYLKRYIAEEILKKLKPGVPIKAEVGSNGTKSGKFLSLKWDGNKITKIEQYRNSRMRIKRNSFVILEFKP